MTNDTIYAAVTTADIAEFLHHLAALRFGAPSADDPAERAAFLARKAELFTRIADQHAPTDPGYAEQVRQMTAQAHTAADHTDLRLPQQPVGPNQRRTEDGRPQPRGARSQEKTGARSG